MLLQGSLLHYAKGITEKVSGGAAIVDCVIVVPSFFGQAQRQAMVDAAHLAGMGVLALVNSHAAAALQWGLDRDFENRTETVVLVDVGAGSTEAALVR